VDERAVMSPTQYSSTLCWLRGKAGEHVKEPPAEEFIPRRTKAGF